MAQTMLLRQDMETPVTVTFRNTTALPDIEVLVRLMPGSSAHEGYGFLRTRDGRQIYFHRRSVLHDGFERLAIGTEVRFEEEDGSDGPQASTVQIVSKPGGRALGRRVRQRVTSR